jgi:peptidoglycan/LPS O-acetylase OafA/YrhL
VSARPPARPARVGRVVDLAAVVLFVAIGRASHHHAESAGGFVSTFWPFGAGLVVAWVLDARLGAGRRWPLAGGAVVAAVTVGAGMVLRVVAGQGTAAAFVVVALAFLGVAMVAGRLAVRAVGHRVSPRRRG